MKDIIIVIILAALGMLFAYLYEREKHRANRLATGKVLVIEQNVKLAAALFFIMRKQQIDELRITMKEFEEQAKTIQGLKFVEASTDNQEIVVRLKDAHCQCPDCQENRRAA